MCSMQIFKDIAAMTAVAFWLFIGAEYAIPISKESKMQREMYRLV